MFGTENNKRSIPTKWAIPVIGAFIVLGTYRGVFSVIALLMSVILIVVSNREDSFCMMFFILPFAGVFKMDPSSQSLFTYICIFYILYMIITRISLDRRFFVTFCLLVFFMLVQSIASVNFLRLIKFFVNIILMYDAMQLNVEKSHKAVYISYVLGVIFSSAAADIGLINGLERFMETKLLGNQAEGVVRFSGLYADPNYYSVNIVISICLIVLLVTKKEMNPFLALAGSGVLVYFVALTLSKSSFLMLALPALMLVYGAIKNKKYFLTAVLGFVVLYILSLLLSGRIEMFNTVLSRFGGDNVTTGRTDLWQTYLEYLRENLDVLFFGRGLNAELVDQKAPHNTYIDFLYYLGVIGSVLFALAVVFIPKAKMTVRRNVLNYSIFMCVMVMYFFLSEIFYVDLPFHLILCLMTLNLPFEVKRKKELEI